ncbi:phytanoyl-CoA dioxygenase family protein [Legionella waltersii]|uniref:Phytanoyl-CoA dioxygenase (PhyH) n=1 Tax=Legionella waltersii TaxID=66969 RepID=A0A0W1AN46_9GAMM|nr:phytanoyl-CoA dioxygenase family protein [Legionella waltersii]KTD82748.1 Phytanoyl-CoA dioxygenase (PhyH) [Legionella waltersii]SNV01081.1 Phytanoyl-CoA dioxygenase (PhyH) [Legionella waltersii]
MVRDLKADFNDDGLLVIKNVLDRNDILVLLEELEAAIEEDKVNYPNVFDKGMVHNCMARGVHMAKLLDNPTLNKYVKKLLAPTCIVYAYQSSSLFPGNGNYGSRIHVDSPRFIPNYITNLGVIFPLNDFTLENGATYFLPGSHKYEQLPSEEFFYKNAKRALCQAGDMIVFHGRLVHAAGHNNSLETRHSLTINLCRSYMRQRFDFPRLVSQYTIDQLGDDGKRLIGMNVRMPTSLDEFYLPEEHRLYKSNQG